MVMIIFYTVPPPLSLGSGAAEATGLGFVCFVVLNPRVLSANRVDLGLFLFHKFSIFTPHRWRARGWRRPSSRAFSLPLSPTLPGSGGGLIGLLKESAIFTVVELVMINAFNLQPIFQFHPPGSTI